jgi:hypothetical protein
MRVVRGACLDQVGDERDDPLLVEFATLTSGLASASLVVLLLPLIIGDDCLARDPVNDRESRRSGGETAFARVVERRPWKSCRT